MNVTFTSFQGLTNGQGDAPATLGSSSESLTGQRLGVANPFALLLNGQLQAAPQGATAQALPMTLAQPAAVATLQNLPASGKPLPDPTLAAQASADAEPGATPASLLPLPWSLATQPIAQEQDPAASLRPGPGADLGLTGNIMKLALGGTDAREPETPVAVTKAGFDDQTLIRAAQVGVMRVEAERAAVLAQAEPAAQPARADGGATNAAVQAAAMPADAARAAEAQRPAPVAQPQPALPQPLGKPGWDQDLGSRLVWMSKHNLDSAQLRLNPAHLGPLEVRLSVQQDQTANVAFISNHASVREAVEAALPRLREMLADSGVTLTDVNVSSQSRGQARQHDADADRSWLGEADADVEAAGAERAERAATVGLVDYFA